MPSKTLRESALFLSGYRQRDLYGVSVEVDRNLEVAKLIEDCGGQMVAILNATSNTISALASARLRGPRSVAKYQPKRISKPKPAKNVNPGLITDGG